MKYTPKQHQAIAEEWLDQHPRCALFLDMGLGKTVVSLTVAMRRIWEDFSVQKMLVIAPIRVAEDTWTREADKWDHLQGLRVSKVLGTQKQRIKALQTPADVYVINRENVVWLVEHLGTKWDFDMVVIDELSSFKASNTKRFKALRKVIRRAKYVVGLTGTPAPNGYGDLWAQIYLIDGGERLGKTVTAFRQRYFPPGRGKGHVVYEWIMNPGAKEAIDEVLSDICLSMSKEDWLEMPDIIYNNVIVKMDKAAKKLYDQFKKEKVLPLLNGVVLDDMDAADEFVSATQAAALSNKLLQMANGAVYEDEGAGVFHIHDAKLDALEEIVESHPGQSLLVFYSYKHDIDRIKKRFPDAVVLNNPTPRNNPAMKRKVGTSEIIKMWNDGKIPMLLCHPASAGHGLNLQEGGHIAVWFGLTWSLELYLQANARLYRQGQEQSVIIHHIICDGTIEWNVLAALQEKDTTQKRLLAALKHFLQ
jgi:SNF2 family DNA or RNA helicase